MTSSSTPPPIDRVEARLRGAVAFLPAPVRRVLGNGWRAWRGNRSRASMVMDVPESMDPEQSAHYLQRMQQEISRFALEEVVNDLPAIFHYWSNTYLRVELEKFGFSHPEDFFARTIAQQAKTLGRRVRVVSIGAGNCDTEVAVARLLRERGVRDVEIECVDINSVMLERGRALAVAEDLGAQFSFSRADFNSWKPQRPYDVVMANQSLHHVTELEHLFAAIHNAIGDDGIFVTSDMIGRNGHERWPEALAIVREFWRELPSAYRYNRALTRHEADFQDWDCSGEGFEGVRAQDILPLAIERFGFDFFYAYGNVIDPFVDRSFGPNFDATKAEDRAFIDRVHARDDAEILAGRITPTHMFAVMRRDRGARPRVRAHLTPAFCVRRIGQATHGVAALDGTAHTSVDSAPPTIATSHPNGHFYSPVVDPAEVIAQADALWPPQSVVLGIDFNDAAHAAILREAFPRYLPEYDYPEHLPESADLTTFFTQNSQFSWLDSRALFVLLRHWRPRRIIEVGSGFSTLLMADVNRRYFDGAMDICCIEPYPREFLRGALCGVRLLEKKVQEIPLDTFDALEAGDILFVDSSHVSKTGSDVNYLYFEVFPRLKPGVRVHVHDIFLPNEYPREWVIDDNRSWNEQYVLRALLMHSTALRVSFGSNYAFLRFPDDVRNALAHPQGHAYGGGSIWLERT